MSGTTPFAMAGLSLHQAAGTVFLLRQVLGGPEVSPAASAQDIVLGPLLVLVTIVGFFGLLGFRGGVRRQALTLFLTALVYWSTTTRWAPLAAQLAPHMPVAGARLQGLIFGGGVLLSHFLGHRLVSAPSAAGAKMVQSLPSLLERLMGLTLGGATGYLVGRFSLLRLPTGTITLVGPRQDVQDILESQAPNVLWLVIGVIILFGVMSLQPKKKKDG